MEVNSLNLGKLPGRFFFLMNGLGARLMNSVSAERVGQWEVGGVTHKVLCPGCKVVMVGTGWANFCPDCMNELAKCCSHLVGCYLGRKGCLGSEQVVAKNAEYYILVNKWVWLK